MMRQHAPSNDTVSNILAKLQLERRRMPSIRSSGLHEPSPIEAHRAYQFFRTPWSSPRGSLQCRVSSQRKSTVRGPLEQLRALLPVETCPVHVCKPLTQPYDTQIVRRTALPEGNACDDDDGIARLDQTGIVGEPSGRFNHLLVEADVFRKHTSCAPHQT